MASSSIINCPGITQLGNPYDYYYEFHTNFTLDGEISPALLELEFLSYLDLGLNGFGGRPIPSFLDSMGSLRYLDLSSIGFGGVVPHQLGDLSTLCYLDLGDNSRVYVENLDWISHLSFLKYLDMDGVDLHREVHWLESMSMIPSLSELHLSGCRLDRNMVSSLGYANCTSLTFLDLSKNNFNLEIPNWLFNLKYLESLNLLRNSFHGPIPTSIGNLSSLRYLVLDENPLINGTLPKSLGLLSNLEHLE